MAKAFEESWTDAEINGDDLEESVGWLLKYWDKLVEVLPPLGKLDITKRKTVRDTSLTDSAVAIHGYIALAARMHKDNVSLDKLKALDTDFFNRGNPLWERNGVLVQRIRKDGKQVTNIRNANQTRRAMTDAILNKVGLTDSQVEAAA